MNPVHAIAPWRVVSGCESVEVSPEMVRVGRDEVAWPHDGLAAMVTRIYQRMEWARRIEARE